MFEYHSFKNWNIFERMEFERTYKTCLYSHERFFLSKRILKERQTNFERTLFDQTTYPALIIPRVIRTWTFTISRLKKTCTSSLYSSITLLFILFCFNLILLLTHSLTLFVVCLVSIASKQWKKLKHGRLIATSSQAERAVVMKSREVR